MQLSAAGIIASKLWQEIAVHFPFVQLPAFVVMPDHVHGIITIDKNDGIDVEARHALPLHQQLPGKNRFRNQGRNTISSIVGSYKSAVAREIHHTIPGFRWQSRFHDHIIRNDGEFERIRKYIIENPLNWKEK
jgi:putative transposase